MNTYDVFDLVLDDFDRGDLLRVIKNNDLKRGFLRFHYREYTNGEELDKAPAKRREAFSAHMQGIIDEVERKEARQQQELERKEAKQQPITYWTGKGKAPHNA